MLLHKVCALLVGPNTAARARGKPQLSKLQGKIPPSLLRRACRWLSDIDGVHGGDMLSRIAAPFLRNKVLVSAPASTNGPRTNAPPD